MGTWGTGISANDVFEDIRDEFFELYDEGLDSDAVSKRLLSSNQELINDQNDSNNFWFAIALCQWECKALNPEVLDRVTNIVESGHDIELWKVSGAKKQDLVKRKLALDKFLIKLNSDRKNPRPRKKKKYFDSIYKKGDCLTARKSNGRFSGAYVLSDCSEEEYAYNSIAITTIDSLTKPVIEDFVKAEVFFVENNSGDAFPLIGMYMQNEFNQVDFEIEVIGNISLARGYDAGNTLYGFPWRRIKEPFFEGLEKKHVPQKKIWIKNWI